MKISTIDEKEEEIEKKVEEKLKEYHYLINDEQARYLISLEESSDYFKPKTIKEAKKSLFPFELEVEVKKVYLLQKTLKNNQDFTTLRILVKDESEEATVVFFDLAAIEVWQKLMIGDKILIGPMKNFNDEFRMLNKGKIRLLKKAPTITNIKNGMIGNFEGKIKNIEDRTYKTKNGETKMMTTFYININKKDYRVVQWESEGLKGILTEDAHVRIENGYVKNNEIWLKANSRLLFQPSKKKKIKIKNFLLQEDRAIIEGEKEKIVFKKIEDLAALLGIKNLAQDINLKKILEIKLNSMIGKFLPENYERYV
ncbi:MAG: hypothetical protein ACK4J0_00115 [Candidatus Anstonellaceae archaeon]